LRFPLIALDANYRGGRQPAPFGELDLCHGAAHPPPFELFADQDHDCILATFLTALYRFTDINVARAVLDIRKLSDKLSKQYRKISYL
jgi:hypothetical protein